MIQNNTNLPKFDAKLIRKNLRDMVDLPHDLDLEKILEAKKAEKNNNLFESQNTSEALDFLSQRLVNKQLSSHQKVDNNPYASLLSNLSHQNTGEIKKLIRHFILLEELNQTLSPVITEKLNEQYSSIIKKCHESNMPIEQLEKVLTPLSYYVHPSVQGNLRKTKQDLISDLYKPINLTTSPDTHIQTIQLDDTQPLRYNQETLDHLLDFAKSKDLSSQIGPLNAQEFLKNARKIEENYLNALPTSKAKTLKLGFEELKDWSDKKEQDTQRPTFSKIGKFLASAVKVVHHTIHGNKDKALMHHTMMTQLSQELSGKSKVFTTNLHNLKPTSPSFAEKIKAEKSNIAPNHNKQR